MFCTDAYSSLSKYDANEKNFIIQRDLDELLTNLFRHYVEPHWNSELYKYFVSLIMNEERLSLNIATDNVAEALLISNYTQDENTKLYLKMKWGNLVDRGV